VPTSFACAWLLLGPSNAATKRTNTIAQRFSWTQSPTSCPPQLISSSMLNCYPSSTIRLVHCEIRQYQQLTSFSSHASSMLVLVEISRPQTSNVSHGKTQKFADIWTWYEEKSYWSMSSKRLRVYDSSRTESDGMLARHQEELRRRAKRGVEAGGYFKVSKVVSHDTDRSLAAGAFNRMPCTGVDGGA